jgi:hypothetical protein
MSSLTTQTEHMLKVMLELNRMIPADKQDRAFIRLIEEELRRRQLTSLNAG